MEDYDSDAVIDAIEAMHSCRCCLRRPPDKGLRTLYTNVGKTEIYLDMLEECFSIRLTMTSDDESGICEVCVGRLRDASEFKQQVQRSQAELQRLQFIHFLDEKPAIKAESVEGNGTNDDFTLREVLPGLPVKLEAKMSEGDLITNEELVQALALAVAADAPKKPEDAPDHALERLKKLDGSVGTLASRNQVAKPISLSLGDEPGQPVFHTKTPPLSVSCNYCQRQFQSKHLLDKHMTRHTIVKPYACEICDKRYSLKSVLKNHLKSHSNKFSCDVCKKEFAYGQNLKRHMRVHTGEKPFGCDICDKKFTKKENLSGHISRSGHTLLISCEICNERFAHETEMDEHIANVHGIIETYAPRTKKRQLQKRSSEKPQVNDVDTNKQLIKEKTGIPLHKSKTNNTEKLFCCEICGKQYTVKRPFQAHMNSHTGVKLEHCNICNKRYADRNSLRGHMLVHTGEKPYPCEVCKRRFRQGSALQCHMLIHKGVKPFSCELCGKEFRHKSALKVHSQRHTGEKTHSCDICQKTFMVLASLNEHVRIHTGEKPYVCNVCKKKFRLSKNVKKHLKRIHNDTSKNYIVLK